MSHAFDVNNAGRAVGFADVDELQFTMPAYWSLDDGRLQIMGSPVPGTDPGIAFGVSEGGWAAGGHPDAPPGRGRSLPRLRLDRIWRALMLPGAEGAWDETDSIAHGVSDRRDEVTGRSAADGTNRPTVWRCASLIGSVAEEDCVMTAQTARQRAWGRLVAPCGSQAAAALRPGRDRTATDRAEPGCTSRRTSSGNREDTPMRTMTVLAATTLLALSTMSPAGATYEGQEGRIAFGAFEATDRTQGDIWSVRPDGSALRQLTDAPGLDICPAYSADGKHIAFCSNRTGSYEIWVMDANGKDERQLTELGTRSTFPDFSPDGSRSRSRPPWSSAGSPTCGSSRRRVAPRPA